MTQFIPPSSLGGSNATYSDDGSGTRDMLAGGHRTWLLPMLGEVITLANSALSSANSAVGSANASGTSSTSISTPTIGSDTVTITTQSGKVWVPGMTLILANTAAPYTQWLTGMVKTYSTTSLVVTVTDFGGTAAWPGTSWTISAGSLPRPAPVTYSSQTAASITIAAGDRGKLLDFVGSTSSTMTFPAAATATAGWFCYIRNATAQAAGFSVTLTPAGAETIDAMSSFKMYPGETRLVICTGSAWQSVVLTPYSILATAGFTFTKPPGYRSHRAKLWGGGASGAGGYGSNSAQARQGGGGGGGGMYVEASIPDSECGTGGAVTIAAAQTSVGAGGNGNAGGAGSNGNNTSLAFGPTNLVARGGSAGSAGTGNGGTGAAGGAGGTPISGFLTAGGVYAGATAGGTTATAGAHGQFSGGGAASADGGAAAANRRDGAAGGSTMFGGAGGGSGASIDSTGVNGTAGTGGTCLSGTTTYTGAGGAGGGLGAAGTNGALPGGGGGGGGAGTSTGGAGGQGAGGMAILSGE